MTRTARLGAAGLSLWVLGWAGACSSDPSADSGPSLDELPQAYAAAACEALTSCLGDALSLFLGGRDCVADTRARVEDLIDGVGAALRSGRVVYDGTRVGACLEGLRTAGCDLDEAGASAACLDAFDGTVTLGGECDFTAECDGTAYCKSDGACPGTCTRPETEGGRCAADADCEPALECDEAKGECVRPGGAGDRCEGGVAPECGAGLFCLGASDADGTAGSCRRVGDVLTAAEGAKCDPVEGPLCGPDLRCTLLAVAPVIDAECRRGVGAGEACTVSFPDPCPDTQYCKVAPGTLTGTCAARPSEGAACAAGPFGDAPDVCAPGTVCDGGTCRARQPLGAACTVDAACLGEHCTGGRCALDGACQ